MSNTNLPPSYSDLVDENQRLRDALERLNDTTGIANRLRKNVVASLKGVRSSFENFVNPVTRLQDSIRRMDKTNREALKLGVTNQKLADSISKNTDVLSRNNVSYEKLQNSFIDAFGKGVREQTESMTELAEEMIATGQNTGALNSLNSELIKFTGNNSKVLDNASKVNKDVSDKYGVSNEKLIQTVNNLAEVMEQASFFGSNAVDSLQTVGQEIAGMVGGTANDPAIRTLLGLATGGISNVAAASITGARGVRSSLAAGGGATTQDFMAILENVSRIAEESGGGEFGLDIAAARTQLSKNQVAQLVNLNRLMKNNFELDKEVKATQDERMNNVQNLEERAKNFYDRTAVQMLAVLGSINTQLLFTGQMGAQAAGGILPFFGGGGGASTGGAGPTPPIIDPATGTIRQGGPRPPSGRGRFSFNPKVGLGVGAAAMGANMLLGDTAQQSGFGNTLNYTSMGASLGAFGGPMGMAVGAGAGLLVGGIMDLVNYSERTAKATEAQLKKEKEKEQRERAEAAAKDRSRLEFLSGYLRSRSDFGDQTQTDLLRGMRNDLRKMAEKEEQNKLRERN